MLSIFGGGNSIAVAGIREVRVANGRVVPHGAELVGSLGPVISRTVIGGHHQHVICPRALWSALRKIPQDTARYVRRRPPKTDFVAQAFCKAEKVRVSWCTMRPLAFIISIFCRKRLRASYTRQYRRVGIGIGNYRTASLSL